MELMMKSLFVVAVILFVENSQVWADNIDSSCSGEWPGRKQNGTSGVITSPNYPGNYGDNLSCRWLIRTPQNMVSRISFDPIFEVERNTTSGHCRDKVSIYNNYVYCGNTAPPTRYYSGVVLILFTSDRSYNYKGFKLFWRFVKVDSCSKTPIIQNGTSGVITSPNHPGNYYRRLDCRWLIQTPENTVVEISFASNFSIQPKSYGRCWDVLTIQSETAENDEYCGNTAPPTRNYTGRVIIKFTSDNSISYKGFKLLWWFAKVDSCSKTPIIQNGTSGVISSPNHPGNYYRRLDCRWLIQTPENRMVEISFDSKFRVGLRLNSGCYDELTIKSGTENGDVYCGYTAPPTRYYSGRVIIRFTSDRSYGYKGFKLFWRFLKVDSTCSRQSRVQSGRTGVITSPNYPGNYGDNLRCRWLIRTPQNMKVEISFDPIFQVDSNTNSDTRNCSRDKLSINFFTENGDVYCGNTAPPTRNYSGEVDIQFRSDNSSSYHKGFELHWKFVKVDSCSKTPIIQNSRSGVISSPNHPNKYYNRLDCRWLIQTPENTVVEISFASNFRIEARTSGRCLDALTIQSETENGDVYCGNTAPPTRNYTGRVIIRFTSGSYRSYSGFKLHWKFVKVDSCSKTPIIQNGTSGVISSPNYPNSYYRRLDCRWLIQTPENTIVEISFDSYFRIEYRTSGGCYDALTIKSGTAENGDVYCGSTAPPTRVYSGEVDIQFRSDNSSSYHKGFKLHWKFVKVDSCSKTPIIQNGTSGVISSPNYPNGYYLRLDCSWLIQTPENRIVEISFDLKFHIQTSKGRCRDALTIKSETGSNQCCGSAAPDNRSHTGNITIQFTSDNSGSGAGFKLLWRIKDTDTDTDTDTDRISYLTVVFGIGFLILVIMAAIAIAVLIRQRRNVRNRNTGNNTTDPGAMYYQPSSSGVGGRIYTTQDGIYEDIDDGEIYDDVDIVDVVVAGVRNVTDDDVDVRNATDDDVDVRNATDDDVDAWNSTDDDVDVWNSTDDDVDDNLVAGVRNPPEDDYVGPDVMNPPEDTYIVAGVRNPPEDTYIVAGVRNPPEDDYVGPDVMNPPEDTYIFTGVRNPPEDTYIVALKPTTTSADDRISPEDDYVGPDVRYSTEDTYVVAGVRNPPEDTYIVPDARNSTEDDYVVVAGVRNPPEDDYVVVAGVRNTPEDTYIVPDARNSTEDDYVVVAGVSNPPEDDYVVVAGVRNTPEDTYIVPDARNSSEDDFVVDAGVRNPPEDTYVVPDIRNTPEDTYIVPDVRNPPEDTYVVADGIRPQLDDNGTMD
ncbi:cubilin-like isoform X2 [Tubulanus polymorphus]|uniref:cubilin-like isoform X2 n=1 Tax=Tubulanus polymorphus TaxID=672921 RepID=UPI003DA683C2